MNRRGFTLIEMMMGASVLAIVIVALAGSFLGQSFLSTNARFLTAAMNDANRVMEEIRRQNMGASCPTQIPSVKPVNYNSWNDWLNVQEKSIEQPNKDLRELVAVTCQEDGDQDADGQANEYCGTVVLGGIFPAQVGSSEWARQAANTRFNPIRVTVSVGWVQRERAMGGVAGAPEFTYVPGTRVTQGKSTVTTPAAFSVGPDQDRDGVIESQAMLTTLVSCR